MNTIQDFVRKQAFYHGDTEHTESLKFRSKNWVLRRYALKDFEAYLDSSPCPLRLCGEMTFFQ
jgi:hypothetical protein